MAAIKMSRLLMARHPPLASPSYNASFAAGSRKACSGIHALVVRTAERFQEPGPGVGPEGVRRPRRDAEQLGCLGDGQAGEIAKLDQLGRLRFLGGQGGQGL